MWSRIKQWSAAPLLGALVLAGCQQSVSKEDVKKEKREAQQAVAQADEKKEDIRHEVRKEIADIESNRDETVRDLKDELDSDPDADAAKIQKEIDQAQRDAERDIAAAREDAKDDLNKVDDDVAAEKSEAAETERKFEFQKARDDFVAEHRAQLKALDLRIEKLEDKSDAYEGDAKERFNTQVNQVQEQRKVAEDALDRAASADEKSWPDQRDVAARAMEKLKGELGDAENFEK
jgi:hypothetical protein